MYIVNYKRKIMRDDFIEKLDEEISGSPVMMHSRSLRKKGENEELNQEIEKYN